MTDPYALGYYAALWGLPRWPNPWLPLLVAMSIAWAHGHSDGTEDARPRPARKLEPECVR